MEPSPNPSLSLASRCGGIAGGENALGADDVVGTYKLVSLEWVRVWPQCIPFAAR